MIVLNSQELSIAIPPIISTGRVASRGVGDIQQPGEPLIYHKSESIELTHGDVSAVCVEVTQDDAIIAAKESRGFFIHSY